MKPITEKDLKTIEEAAFRVACEQIYNDSSINGLLKTPAFKNYVNMINDSLVNIKYCGPLQKLFSDLRKVIEYVETEKIIYKNATYKDGSEIIPEGEHKAVLIDIQEDTQNLSNKSVKLSFVFCSSFKNERVFLTYKLQDPTLQFVITLALCIDNVFNVGVEIINGKAIITYIHNHKFKD